MSELHSFTRCALCGNENRAELYSGTLALTSAVAMLCDDTVACARRRYRRDAEITRGTGQSSRALSEPGTGNPQEQGSEPQDLGEGARETTKPVIAHRPVSGSLTEIDALKLLYEVVTVVTEADPHGADDRAIGRDVRAEIAGVTLAEVGLLISQTVAVKLITDTLDGAA